jgi:hypothetical protein
MLLCLDSPAARLTEAIETDSTCEWERQMLTLQRLSQLVSSTLAYGFAVHHALSTRPTCPEQWPASPTVPAAT